MDRRAWCVVCALWAVALSASAGTGPAWAEPGPRGAEQASVSVAPTGPLSAQARDVFMGSAEDPPAKKLLGVNEDYEGRSYLAGDEWNLHLFYPKIKGVGGGYMGVGSDQAYLLMSWSRPTLAWLMDYDPLVLETHKVYFALFREAKTPEEFLRLWSSAGQEQALALLDRDYKDDPNLPIVRKVYTSWRVKILRRHERLIKILKAQKIPSYLHDQDSYDAVRQLVIQGRVRPIQANLLDKAGLLGIGQAARQLGVPIRVLYLSNAEEYWSYPAQYRQNIQGLYFDESSYTLHTLSTWTTNKDYRYAIQPSLKYVEWLKRDWVKKVYTMIPRRKLEGPDDIDFMEFELDVEQVEARRAKKGKKN